MTQVGCFVLRGQRGRVGEDVRAIKKRAHLVCHLQRSRRAELITNTVEHLLRTVQIGHGGDSHSHPTSPTHLEPVCWRTKIDRSGRHGVYSFDGWFSKLFGSRSRGEGVWHF